MVPLARYGISHSRETLKPQSLPDASEPFIASQLGEHRAKQVRANGVLVDASLKPAYRPFIVAQSRVYGSNAKGTMAVLCTRNEVVQNSGR